jgi:hypothetical protein
MNRSGDERRPMAQGACAERGEDRLRPLAAHGRMGQAGDCQLAAKGAELVAVKRNPIDAVWADQPDRRRPADRPA